MRKFLIIIMLTLGFKSYSQIENSYFTLNYFYGNIIKHKADASVFLQGHPTGVYLSFNTKTFGEKYWQTKYNYPDLGFSLGYIDFKSDILGKLYAVYGHYNFYLLKNTRKSNLILRAGIGLAYNTNPYNKESNNKNIAFGTHLNSSTYFKLYFQRELLLNKLGFNAGFNFIHASNSSFKSPNSGVNIWSITAGLNYNLSETTKEKIVKNYTVKTNKEPIKINIAVRGGINESDIIGSGQKPFFVGSVYLDKRLNYKSAIQLGADLYLSPMLKEYYKINQSIPHTNLKESNDFSRIGLFIGHELFINKLSIETQLAYYLKYPFEYKGRVYETLGLKRYISKKWFLSTRLKAHAANAETIEFGFGIRL